MLVHLMIIQVCFIVRVNQYDRCLQKWLYGVYAIKCYLFLFIYCLWLIYYLFLLVNCIHIWCCPLCDNLCPFLYVQWHSYKWFNKPEVPTSPIIMIDFNKICCWAVTEYTILENNQPQQILSRVAVVYGEDVPSYTTVMHWSAKFCWGKRSLEDESHSRCSPETAKITVMQTHAVKNSCC